MPSEVTTRVLGCFGNDDGQALVEYGLILTLIAILAVSALAVLGGKVGDMLDAVATAL